MNRIVLNETSYFGVGCRSVIAVEAARRGFKKAFFVTDKDLIRFGVAAEVMKVFEANNIPYELYSDVESTHSEHSKKRKTTNDFARLSFSVGMRRLELPTPTSRT